MFVRSAIKTENPNFEKSKIQKNRKIKEPNRKISKLKNRQRNFGDENFDNEQRASTDRTRARGSSRPLTEDFSLRHWPYAIGNKGSSLLPL
jgi:hypothetical protein